MHEDGSEIPAPSPIDQVAELDDAKDARAIVLVEGRFAGPTVRGNSAIPASLVARGGAQLERGQPGRVSLEPAA